MKTFFRNASRLGFRRPGFALVITLAALVIVTVLVLAFFSRALLNRQVSFSSTNMAKADHLAKTSLDFITAELRQEIRSGSTALNGGNTNFPTVYQPLANSNALPVKIGVMNPDAIGQRTLVKVSSSGLPIRPSGAATASSISTGAPSVNSRYLTAARWFGAGGPGLGSQSNNLPTWFYITRGDGITTPALAAAGDQTGGGYVIGRFAFTIYDVSGMLDANVAGYPSVAADNAAFKSSAAYADLTALDAAFTTNKVNDFVAWRNGAADSATAAAYQTYLTSFAAPRGFLEAKLGHNAFLFRKDLLNAAAGGILPSQTIPCLSHASRARTAPSWRPTQDTAASYKDNAENPNSENRNLANVRAADGSLLIRRRFPLSRLALLTPAATANAGDPIHDYFGLTRSGSSSSWVYDHGNAHSILTLDEVKAEGREPDFFELLKAVILNGSLGRDPGGGTNPRAVIQGAQNNYNATGPCGQFFGLQGAFAGYSAIPDRQIIQIGANIIDQYDSDSFPTSIYFDAVTNPGAFPAGLNALFNTAHGVENLPYLFALRTLRWRDAADEPPNGHHHAWFQPALWNPHQQLPATYSGAKPANFRLRIYGRSQMEDWAGSGMGAYAPTSERIMDYDNPAPAYANFQYITFSDSLTATSPFYDHPVWLNAAQANSPNAINKWKAAHGAGVGQFVAFYAGHIKAAPSGTTYGAGLIVGANDPATITIVAEYEDAAGNWQPYNQLARYNAFNGHNWLAVSNPSISVLGNTDLSRVDPRTDRFSLAMGWSGMATAAAETAGSNSYWPNSATMREAAGFVPKPNAGFAFSNLRLGNFAANTTSSSARYMDPDGELRPGDAFRGNGADGQPTFSGGVTGGRRSLILNRPFESVGELGYVFRDLPFKTLDLWSKDSADAGLLDVFCLEEEPDIAAGRINPNGAPAPVLQAVLAGARKKNIDPATGIDSDESQDLAEAIVTYIEDKGPLVNRADLVTHTNGSANLSGSINAAFSAAADRANKAYSETAVRALAPVSDMRTWNLLVDVIAQTGRLSPNADGLEDFLVEGERRYWLHLAIDRYSGEVVDQQLEPVYE